MVTTSESVYVPAFVSVVSTAPIAGTLAYAIPFPIPPEAPPPPAPTINTLILLTSFGMVNVPLVVNSLLPYNALPPAPPAPTAVNVILLASVGILNSFCSDASVKIVITLSLS